MKLLTRYVLREFLIPLGYCLTGFIGIYILFELFGSFSRLVEAHLPWDVVVKFFLGYLSPYFMWLAPAAMMLATLYTMWNFCHHSEIIAMRANGVGFFVIVRPILAVAFLMSLFVLWVNECYVPAHAQEAKSLKAEHFDLAKVARAEGVVYRNSKANRTWTAARAEQEDGSCLREVRVVCERSDGTREMTLVATKADYLDGEWWFTKPHVDYYDESGNEVVSPTPELEALPFRCFVQFRERPSDIVLQNRDWAFNSVRGKLRFLRTHADIDLETRRKRLYNAWAQAVSPFASIIITLFAIPAGIASGRQSVFRGILGALIMFFSFYALTIGGMVAASRGWLAPIPAAFLPDLIFLLLGIRAFYRQR